jgi:hypothetical protein
MRPKWGGTRAEEWVAKIVQGDIERELAEIHESIRANMVYIRKQLEVFPAEGGFGSIRTPDFQYTISVGLHDDFTQALFTSELSDVRHPDVLSDDGFTEIFDGSFEAIRLSFEKSINVEDLIDKAEAKRLPVDYPPDCSSCRFEAADGGTVRVTEEHLTLSYARAKSLKQLTTGLGLAIRNLPKFDGFKALPQLTQPQLE